MDVNIPERDKVSHAGNEWSGVLLLLLLDSDGAVRPDVLAAGHVRRRPIKVSYWKLHEWRSCSQLDVVK